MAINTSLQNIYLLPALPVTKNVSMYPVHIKGKFLIRFLFHMFLYTFNNEKLN